MPTTLTYCNIWDLGSCYKKCEYSTSSSCFFSGGYYWILRNITIVGFILGMAVFRGALALESFHSRNRLYEKPALLRCLPTFSVNNTTSVKTNLISYLISPSAWESNPNISPSSLYCAVSIKPTSLRPKIKCRMDTITTCIVQYSPGHAAIIAALHTSSCESG
jgi:hypothetical protein